jgi:hypothetical protein
MPSRVIADRIKIDDLLTALAERYRGFAGLQERTRVYARPYHYQPTLRLGLTYAQNAGWASYFPFYLNYTGGTPYRFQSRVMIGNIVHDALPFTRRTLSAASDIKSHFFHATFVGHLPGLPAETDPFFVDDGEIEAYTVTTSYNYLILMGVDYWRLSASAGPAYFSFRFAGEIEYPIPLVDGSSETVLTEPYAFTVVATSVSPVFRLQYRADRWMVRALYYRSRLAGLPEDLELPLATAGLSFRPKDLTLVAKADAVRIGVTAQLPARITVELDQIFSFSSLDARLDESPDPQFVDLALAASHFESETALMVGAEFGRYIAVKGFARFLVRRYRQDLELGEGRDSKAKHIRFDPLFGGALEFVF